MEAVVEKKRRRRSSREITALIEEYRQSGQTRREFCQSHGLALSSFQSSMRRRRQRSGQTERGALREVQIVGAGLEMRGCGLVVISRSGYQVRVERDFDPIVLRRLLAALDTLAMFGLGAATRIYVAVGPTDMRKGFEGLFGLVNERLGLSPLRGHLFLFANARWNRLKVLYWDGKPGCGSAVRQTIHNARKGYLRVLYPYHPYYGQTFEVFGSHGGLRDLVYIRMPNNATRGIPAWMFDETICASIRCADRQTIDCWALLKLAQLLDLQVESRGIGKHESSIPESKIASKIFHRQTILALEKLPLNGQMPSGVRSKC